MVKITSLQIKMPIKITREEYQKKFGVAPDFSTAKVSTSEKKPGYISRVVSEVKNSVKEGAASLTKSAKGEMNPFAAGANIAKNVTGAVLSPLSQAPGMQQIGQGFNKVGEEFTKTKLGENITDTISNVPGQVLGGVSDTIQTGANVGALASLGEGGTKAKSGVSNLTEGVADTGSKVMEHGKNFAGDVISTPERMVNHQVTRALELTASDVKNIAQSTGNEVGKWIADKNLIGKNVAETVANVKNLYDKSYNAVRTEIGKVQKQYKLNNVPRYTDALNAIYKKIEGVPGLEKVTAEVDNLKNKTNIKLSDVQRVKELMDDHFNLYKATGDVSEGVAKEGLANIRSEIKSFIENQVKKETGSDIEQLNNDVQTARGIQDAVELRSTSGLTKSNLKIGDFGAFGLGFSIAGPIGGAAAIFLKKLAESSSVQLRVAKFFDTLSDASKAKIQSELKSGKIPAEFNQFIKGRH